jgi:hypothetical protein
MKTIAIISPSPPLLLITQSLIKNISPVNGLINSESIPISINSPPSRISIRRWGLEFRLLKVSIPLPLKSRLYILSSFKRKMSLWSFIDAITIRLDSSGITLFKNQSVNKFKPVTNRKLNSKLRIFSNNSTKNIHLPSKKTFVHTSSFRKPITKAAVRSAEGLTLSNSKLKKQWNSFKLIPTKT